MSTQPRLHSPEEKEYDCSFVQMDSNNLINVKKFTLHEPNICTDANVSWLWGTETLIILTSVFDTLDSFWVFFYQVPLQFVFVAVAASCGEVFRFGRHWYIVHCGCLVLGRFCTVKRFMRVVGKSVWPQSHYIGFKGVVLVSVWI